MLMGNQHHFTAAAVSAALAAVPELILRGGEKRRLRRMDHGASDAVDLMVMALDAGLPIDAALDKTAFALRALQPSLGRILSLAAAEARFLPSRNQAFANIAIRCPSNGMKALSSVLMQADGDGMAAGERLRAAAAELRDARLMDAERKAASLPAKLAVPLIVFFLPAIFVIMLAPELIRFLAR
jgi:tight adherence protein C